MIEIAPQEYWIKTSFDSMKMFLFSLNIDGKSGWRVPTQSELMKEFDTDNEWDILDWYWIRDDLTYDSEYWNTREFLIIPVRDLKDNETHD